MKTCLFKSNGQWYFHVKSSNGKIICQSEAYKKKQSALKTIEALRAGMASCALVDLN